tara:strand:+ start:147 stop:464 length:318 start_codon:yes stop_codon:yes gene_type:complete
MARQAQKKNESRRTRSFNVDEAHYRELKSVGRREGLSMSDILNRVLAHGLAKRKVAKDIEDGLQTTLEVHVQSEEIRSKRDHGKCNPKSIDNSNGPCAVCWGELS